MISILTDEDLKRDDLKMVPINHIELSDFHYYHDPTAAFIGQSKTILFFRDGLIKVFKHLFDFSNKIVPLDELPNFLA